MSLQARFVNILTKILLKLTCRINKKEISKIPLQGPGVIISNHTSNIEGPMYYVYLWPRKSTALGKRSLWEKPFTRMYMKAWNIIPLERGAMDMHAIREGCKALDNGYFLGIAPEGTRSKDGKLRKGKAGATFFATHNKVPIYPVVQWGLTEFLVSFKKLRRAKVTIRVGKPFFLEKKDDTEISTTDRRKMADEMMYQIAELLPEEFRGEYSDLRKKTEDFITFIND